MPIEAVQVVSPLARATPSSGRATPTPAEVPAPRHPVADVRADPGNTAVVGRLAAQISGGLAEGRLEPWQAVSSQHLLHMAAALESGDLEPPADRVVEAGLTYLVNTLPSPIPVEGAEADVTA